MRGEAADTASDFGARATLKASLTRSIDGIALPVVFLLIALSQYLIFIHVPNERMMGPIQRIFYFHVGSATACYVAFGVVLIASLAYIATRNMRMDALAHAAAEVGFVFCTVVLVSGMIWGHAAWNTWFRFEPRLVSFLFLWLIFLSYNLLRLFGDQDRVASHAAVLGILGALTIPAVIYSIKLLPQVAQLHPQVVENRGLREASFRYTMFYTMISLVLFQGYLVWLRYRVALLERSRLLKRVEEA